MSRETMSRSVDAVVIGGGVIGAAIAYFLSTSGAEVVLLERGEIAGGTSGACDGFVILQSKEPGPVLELAISGAQLYPQLVSELEKATGYDVEYERNGGIVVAETKKEFERLRARAERQRAAGLDVEVMPADALRKREPAIGEHVVGGTYSAGDAQVNPILLTLAFAEAARRNGARVLRFAPVAAIETTHDSKPRSGASRGTPARRVRAIVTEAGERFITNVAVNAAGVWSPEIARMAGVELPVIPRRGQVLVTEPMPRIVRHVILGADYLSAKGGKSAKSRAERGLGVGAAHEAEQHEPGRGAPLEANGGLGVGASIEQTKSGNLLLGSTREFVGYDRRTTIEGMYAVKQAVCRLVPPLRRASLIRTFAGLRPYVPDGRPILGEHALVRGFFAATGHEGDGIALGPATGKLIADLIVTGKRPAAAEEFSPNRFPEARRG